MTCRVAISRSKEVSPFGPPISAGAIYPKSKKFADFLLAKGLFPHFYLLVIIYKSQL